jgi:hypothetical protein
MRATKFTLKESSSRWRSAAHMRRLSCAVSVNKSSSLLSPLTDTVLTSSTAATVSTGDNHETPSTLQSSGTPPIVQKPKEKLIQKNSRAMQKHCVNKLAKSDHMKRALKRASTWYA